MPSNQQEIIEQAKFNYSPLGKAFEKQTKTIEDQREKQINVLKSLESLKPKEVKPEETKPIGYDYCYIDKMAEIRNLSKQIDFNDLTYVYKGDSAPTNFIGFKAPLHLFKSIYNDDIALEDVEKERKEFKSDIGRIKQGNPKNKSKEQSKVIDNVTNLYESREKVAQMFNNYPREKSRRIYE